jgi:hypothetical protein
MNNIIFNVPIRYSSIADGTNQGGIFKLNIRSQTTALESVRWPQFVLSRILDAIAVAIAISFGRITGQASRRIPRSGILSLRDDVMGVWYAGSGSHAGSIVDGRARQCSIID